MKKIIHHGMSALLLFALLLISSILFSNTVTAATKNGLRIHAIDLGSSNIKGDAVLLESQGEYLLIDTGEEDSSHHVIKYLQKLGVKNLSIYISHFHSDHVGELMNIINSGKFTINHLYAGKRDILANAVKFVRSDSSVSAKEKQQLEGVLDKYDGLKAKVNGFTVVTAGHSFHLGDATVTTLGTPNFKVSDFKDDASLDPSLSETKLEHYMNNMSLCTLITVKQSQKTFKYLTCGDAETAEENWLLKQGYQLDSDIFKMNHHGTDTSNSKNFLSRVKAEHAFSTHYVNSSEIKTQNAIYKKYKMKGKTASTKTAKKLLYGMNRTYIPMTTAEKYGEVYRTEFNGSIVFNISNNSITQTSNTGFRTINGATYLYVNNAVNKGNKDGFITDYCDSLFKVNSNGAIQRGFYTYKAKKYYCYGSHGMAVIGYGFYKVKGKTYYSDNYCSYATTGWKLINKKRYYFDKKTAIMAQNCVKKVGSDYIYFTKKGLQYKKSGWVTLGANKYYITPKAKKTGKVFTKGLIKIGKYKYYFAKNGKMARNKKIKVKGVKYKFDKKGRAKKK